MIIPVDKTTTFSVNFGRTRTGRDVSYRILYSDLSVKTDWTSTGVVEIGNGMYGIAISIDEEMNGFMQWKGEESGSNTLYAGSSLTVVEDFIDKIGRVLKVTSGRWRILNNQMIFYDSDSATPLYTFDLKDSSGDPTESDPYERVPV